MGNHFRFTTCLQPLVPVILLAALSIDVAHPQQLPTSNSRSQSASSASTSTAAESGVSVVIGSDAQFTWWRGGDDTFCKIESCEAQQASDNNTTLIVSMSRADDLAWPRVKKGAGNRIPRPSGMIMNGDLTDFWHEAQAQQYKQFYNPTALQNMPYYPGLGNHDYAINVGDCSYQDKYAPDNNMCAKQAIYYMADLLEHGGIPNLVNKDLSGYVMFENLGGFKAKMSATYTVDGVNLSATTEERFIGQIDSIVLPSAAHDIYVDLQWNDGSKWHSAQRYYTAYAAGGVCYSIRGAVWNTSTQLEPCSRSEWPDGSYGSLSYSYDIGNYHFVQLNLNPDYEKTLTGGFIWGSYTGPFGLAKNYTPSFKVRNSWAWLGRDLAAATAAGKFIVLNMHASDGPLGPGQPPEKISDFPINQKNLVDALSGNRVVAIFSGHIHMDFGYMGAIPVPALPFKINDKAEVPWFRSGSAECRRFLIAEFGKGYFNVGAAVADRSGPSWAPTQDVCDANFSGYNKNSATTVEPASYLITSDFGLTVTTTDVHPNSAGGGTITITGTLNDPGVDVTLSMNWMDNTASSTLVVPRAAGKANFTLYHNYKDDGNYLAYLTATDGVLASSELTVQIGAIDSKPPVTTALIATVNGKQNLTLTATDVGTGVKEILYIYDNQPVQVYTRPGPVVIPPGVQTVYFWSIDQLDNLEAKKSISVDAAPPVTTATFTPSPLAYGWFNAPTVTAILSATDAKSGVDKTYYALDGGSATQYTAPIKIAGDGRHSLDFWSVDKNGNQEPRTTKPIQIDTKPPTVSVQATPVVYSGAGLVMLSISASVTDTLSGIDPLFGTYTLVGPNGSGSGSFGFMNYNTVLSLGSIPNETYTVTVTFRDLPGNVASATTKVTTPVSGF
jgi:hypothetical protein